MIAHERIIRQSMAEDNENAAKKPLHAAN